MNEYLRSQFPIAESLVYLNHAAVSPPPVCAVEAVAEQVQDVQLNGSGNFGAWLKTKERARRRLAEILGARAEQVAFMRNTSDALSCVANGLQWRAGDNIVSFSGEFPSNIYPWLRLQEAHGVALRLCGERAGRVDVDELLGLIDEHTRVVAISWVQFASGYRADLERIGRAARARDALLVVDVIQGLGALPMNVAALGIDAAAGAGHKWLLAPEGVGFLYLSDRARDRLTPTLVGWVSVPDPDDYTNHAQGWKEGALAWESGTFANALVYGLRASLELLQETGVARIAAHLEDLTDYLCERLAGRDYEVVSSRTAGEKSQIVCVRHRNPSQWSPMALYKHLQGHGIIVSPRNGRLRIAPHLYNTQAEIDALIAALP